MTFVVIFCFVWVGCVVFAYRNPNKESNFKNIDPPNGLTEAEQHIIDNAAHGHPELGSTPFGWCTGKNNEEKT